MRLADAFPHDSWGRHARDRARAGATDARERALEEATHTTRECAYPQTIWPAGYLEYVPVARCASSVATNGQNSAHQKSCYSAGIQALRTALWAGMETTPTVG